MKSISIKNISLAKLKEHWGISIIILMLFSVFIYQCIVSFGSVPFIVTRATFDDTFLYLEVARNWANLGYPSFDGETITNGIQPLWGALLFFLALFIKDNILLLISGKAKVFWAHKAYDISLKHIIQQTLQSSWENLTYNFLVVSGDILNNPNVRLILLGILMIVSCVYGLVKLKQQRLWLFISIFVIMVVHTIILNAILQQFSNAFWYYQPLRVIMSLGVGCIAILFTNFNGITRYIRYILIGLGLLLFAYTGRQAVSDLKYAKPYEHFYMLRVKAAEWLDTTPLIADGARIGAWNAGQLGFFTKKRVVVNLDGLVQNPQFLEEVLYTGNWKDYFRQNNIRYLVDYNAQDSTQTYKQKWDKNILFRNIVPLSQAKVIKKFGGFIEVLDISPWLENNKEDFNSNNNQ